MFARLFGPWQPYAFYGEQRLNRDDSCLPHLKLQALGKLQEAEWLLSGMSSDVGAHSHVLLAMGRLAEAASCGRQWLSATEKEHGVRSVESTYARAHLAQILASMSVDAKAMSAHAKAMSAHAKESESLLISSNNVPGPWFVHMARARAYRLLSMVHAAEDEYSLAFPLPEGDAPIKCVPPTRCDEETGAAALASLAAMDATAPLADVARLWMQIYQSPLLTQERASACRDCLARLFEMQKSAGVPAREWIETGCSLFDVAHGLVGTESDCLRMEQLCEDMLEVVDVHGPSGDTEHHDAALLCDLLEKYAGVYKFMSLYVKARMLLERALRVKRQHGLPSAATVSKLAHICSILNDNAAVIALYRQQALAVERVRGAGHDDTIDALASLAEALSRAGIRLEAEHVADLVIQRIPDKTDSRLRRPLSVKRKFAQTDEERQLLDARCRACVPTYYPEASDAYMLRRWPMWESHMIVNGSTSSANLAHLDTALNKSWFYPLTGVFVMGFACIVVLWDSTADPTGELLRQLQMLAHVDVLLDWPLSPRVACRASAGEVAMLMQNVQNGHHVAFNSSGDATYGTSAPAGLRRELFTRRVQLKPRIYVDGETSCECGTQTFAITDGYTAEERGRPPHLPTANMLLLGSVRVVAGNCVVVHRDCLVLLGPKIAKLCIEQSCGSPLVARGTDVLGFCHTVLQDDRGPVMLVCSTTQQVLDTAGEGGLGVDGLIRQATRLSRAMDSVARAVDFVASILK